MSAETSDHPPGTIRWRFFVTPDRRVFGRPTTGPPQREKEMTKNITSATRSMTGMYQGHPAKKKGDSVPAGAGRETCSWIPTGSSGRRAGPQETLRATNAWKSPPSVGRIFRARVAYRTPATMPE